MTEIFSWQLLDGILNSVWFFVSFTRSLFRYIPVRAQIEGVKEKNTKFFVILAEVAQLVEQRTENPCVDSSILPLGI